MLEKQVYELGKGWCGAVIFIHFIPQFKHSYKHQKKNIAFKGKKPVNIALCFASQVHIVINSKGRCFKRHQNMPSMPKGFPAS